MAEGILPTGDNFQDYRSGGDGEQPPVYSPRPRLPRPEGAVDQPASERERPSAESGGMRSSSGSQDFPDRRFGAGASNLPPSERRQFHSNYEKLSPAARDLALAIDRYKIQHHRRFIDHEEMLQVILSLGYTKQSTT
jgi:hypothetical protein